MTERYEHFACATSEISRYLRRLAGEEMKQHGLRASLAVYFMILANHHTGLTATRLCELSGRDKADVSRMLSFMEMEGYAVKEGAPQQLYNGAYVLTEKGMEIAKSVKRRAVKAMEIAGRDLTEDTRTLFYSALDSVVDNLRELTQKGIPD